MYYLEICRTQYEFSDEVFPLLMHPSFCKFLCVFKKDYVPTIKVHVEYNAREIKTNYVGYSYDFGDSSTFFSIEDMDAVIIEKGMSLTHNHLCKNLSFIVSVYLLRNNGLFLHASAISYMGKGVLFSGDSGIGKSTQARLWAENNGSQMINHDKPIIRRLQNDWFVFGSPWSGEDPCYMNVEYHMACIVFLGKASSCRVVSIERKKCFNMLLQQARGYLNYEGCYDDLLKVIARIASDIPMYIFECTRTPESSDYLLNFLVKESVL